MKHLEIIFKGGATIVVDAIEVTTTRNGLNNALTGIEWTTPADPKRKLMTVDVDSIAAVVVIA